MTEERIKSDMNLIEVFTALGEGNPGGLRVCMDLFKLADRIDPDGGMGGMGPLLGLDTLRIYGSRIWLLYKDLCGQDYVRMDAVLRAWQLGYVSREDIHSSLDRCVSYEGEMILTPEKITDLHAKVREFLPSFAESDEVLAAQE